MKTQQQIEKFIETVENLIPKLEEKQLEYLRQGNEFGFNVMKDKIKERLIELNTVCLVLDNSSINEECVAILEIITKESFTFSKEDLGL